MHKRLIYVLVKNFKGINEDVDVFDTYKAAQKAFFEYTGFSYSKDYQNPEAIRYNENFSETKIYEIAMQRPSKARNRGISSNQLTLPFNMCSL
jgi:hypothetical protein